MIKQLTEHEQLVEKKYEKQIVSYHNLCVLFWRYVSTCYCCKISLSKKFPTPFLVLLSFIYFQIFSLFIDMYNGFWPKSAKLLSYGRVIFIFTSLCVIYFIGFLLFNNSLYTLLHDIHTIILIYIFLKAIERVSIRGRKSDPRKQHKTKG